VSIIEVTRELLVRYLDTWVVTALRRSRRVTFAQVWTGEADPGSAEAALRVFAEFGDRLRGRHLAHVVAAGRTDDTAARLDTLQNRLGTPPELGVFTVDGDPAERLPAALAATGAPGAPLLAMLDVAGPAEAGVLLPALAAGRPGEVLVVTAVGEWPRLHRLLSGHGYPLTSGVELVGPSGGRLLGFGTSSARSLELYKNELWAVDEFAGVRFRDPADPQGRLVDVTLTPDVGPLRRELLQHLAQAGTATVTQLRHVALTATVYRVADTDPALSTLLGSGAVARTPEHGRLGGDVLIARADG